MTPIAIHTRTVRAVVLLIAAALALALSGCTVGPKYVRPSTPLAPEFNEPLPENFKSVDGWKPAQPSDAQLRGDWWTLFDDLQLDALEAEIDPANQTLRQAEANFQAARAVIRFNRASEAPTIGTEPSVGAIRESNNQPYLSISGSNTGEGNFVLPFDLDYEIDLWGRIRRTVAQSREEAQASAADLATSRLSLHAELAIDYFDLRSDDAQRRLLADTVTAYQSALQLTEDRYNGGASPLSDVTQARTQLQAAQVQETDVAIQRAMYDHAIAVLIGKPPAMFTLPPDPISVDSAAIPAIPGMLPSQLLERRPDIASAERNMAAANEQIGIARTAYYPTLSLSAVAGFAGTSALNWFSWPSSFFAVGPTMSQTLFDHGRRRAVSDIAVDQYDATVAFYRQTTLTAFQQVEDNLNALHNLEIEARQQRAATASAQQSLDLFNTRYEGGVDTYLQVITWQTALLQNQRNDIYIVQRRFEASVLLVKALGGGWDTSQLPQHP
ncbi:MAG: efflux transporter outer membrane subunit [Acidobacteriaceae bacterium]